MSEADFEDEHFEDSFETLQKGGSAQSLQNKQKRQRSEDQKDLDSDNVVAIEHNLSALSEIERGKLVKRHCSDVLAGIEQLKDCLLEISSHETQELSSLRLLLASLLQFYLCQRASAPQKKLECHPIHNVLGRASLLIQEWSIVGTPVGIVDDKELPVSVNEKKKTLHVTEISNTLEERSQTSHENTAADSDADDGDLVYYESLLQNTRQRKTDREEAVQRMRQDIQESNRYEIFLLSFMY